MNRRERWDRAFEKALNDLKSFTDGFSKDLEKFKVNKERLDQDKWDEHQRRETWDADHVEKSRSLEQRFREVDFSATEQLKHNGGSEYL